MHNMFMINFVLLVHNRKFLAEAGITLCKNKKIAILVLNLPQTLTLVLTV